MKLACPECGKQMRRKTSIKGDFFWCSGFPGCRYTDSVDSCVERLAREANAAQSDVEFLKDRIAAFGVKLAELAAKAPPDLARKLYAIAEDM